MLRCLFCDKELWKTTVVWSFRSLLLKNYSWRLCFFAFSQKQHNILLHIWKQLTGLKAVFFPPVLSLLSSSTFSFSLPSSLPLSLFPSFIPFFPLPFLQFNQKISLTLCLYWGQASIIIFLNTAAHFHEGLYNFSWIFAFSPLLSPTTISPLLLHQTLVYLSSC